MTLSPERKLLLHKSVLLIVNEKIRTSLKQIQYVDIFFDYSFFIGHYNNPTILVLLTQFSFYTPKSLILALVYMVWFGLIFAFPFTLDAATDEGKALIFRMSFTFF